MRRRAGFTLLELLVVMAIIVVVIGLVVIRIDDAGARDTAAGAERLSIALENARDNAIYSGKSMAFSSDGVGYQFWMEDDRQHRWLPLTDDTHLLARKLPGDVHIVRQNVNGIEQALGQRLVFAADGLSEPFSLLVQGGKSRLLVQADALGRISVGPVQEHSDAP